MAITFEPWVSETGTLTGTDPTYTVPNTATTGSGNQFLRTIGAAFTSATDIVLSIASASPNQAEMSVWSFTPGTGGAAGTITRTQLIKSSTGSAINWSGVACTIECTEPLPTQTSAGAASAGLLTALGASGVLDSSLVPASTAVEGYPYPTGSFLTPAANNVTNYTPDASKLFFVWIPLKVTQPVTGMTIESWAAPSASISLRGGLYLPNASANGAPGSLIIDAGDFTFSTNTDPVWNFATAQSLDVPGVWAAVGTPSNLQSWQWVMFQGPYSPNAIGLPAALSSWGSLLPDQSNTPGGYAISNWTYGALPADGSAASMITSNTTLPFVGLVAQ